MIMTVRSARVGAVALLALLAASCAQKSPKGQVLAVVNGQEVTVQDLAAEARARKLTGKVNERALLQEVVGRVLLAQDAHARKLDKYPGYPADMARLQQTFLADKILASQVKPVGVPSVDQAQAFIAANPTVFGNRQQFHVHLIRYQPGGAAAAIGEPQTMDGAQAKLKSLNVNFDQATQVLDSAVLPRDLTQHLEQTPNGQYVQFKQGPLIIGVVVDSRQAATATPDQQLAAARQIMVRNATESQVRAIVDKLRAAGKVAYQASVAPPPTAPAAAANKAS